MIKYASIDGYTNVGEIEIFSHVYQFVESGKEIPKIILLHAYRGATTNVFKGYLYTLTKTFINEKLTEHEAKVIEDYCGGELCQVGFDKFIKGTNFAQDYLNFKEVEEK